jgi:hypothetical protein
MARGFDENKDKLIKSLGVKQLNSFTRLESGIYSYDNGPKKLRIVRVQESRGGNKFFHKSIVSVDADELEHLQSVIEFAAEQLGLN